MITGDFFQLPPVKPFKTCLTCGCKTKSDSDYRPKEHYCPDHGTFYEVEKFAFCSPTWEHCRFQNVELKRIHRQEDGAFSALLNKIRVGLDLTLEEEGVLMAERSDIHGNNAVQIFPIRDKVDRINDYKLSRELSGEEITFCCVDGFEWNQDAHPELEDRFDRVVSGDETSPFWAYGGKDRHRFEDSFKMKVGMEVILLSNIRKSLVNGSRGRIIGFEVCEPNKLPRRNMGTKINQDAVNGSYVATTASTKRMRFRRLFGGLPINDGRLWSSTMERQKPSIQFARCRSWESCGNQACRNASV